MNNTIQKLYEKGTHFISSMGAALKTDASKIKYDVLEHQAVYTVEEAKQLENMLDEEETYLIDNLIHYFKELEKYNYYVQRHSGNVNLYFGGVHGITFDAATGTMHGGADTRRDGKALGY